MPDFDDTRDAAFAAMEATFAQTERGRWFLAEYARRNRNADTAEVLAAIAAIGAKLVQPPQAEPAPLPDPRAEILAGLLAEMAAEDAAAPVTDPPAMEGSRAAAILDAAEQIQEVAWTLRESGHDGAACDLLDQRASDIYAACAPLDAAIRDAEGLRARLARLEARLSRLRAAAMPAERPDAGTADVRDGRPGGEVFVRDEAELQRQQLAILAEIDKLGLHEKLRLFT